MAAICSSALLTTAVILAIDSFGAFEMKLKVSSCLPRPFDQEKFIDLVQQFKNNMEDADISRALNFVWSNTFDYHDELVSKTENERMEFAHYLFTFASRNKRVEEYKLIPKTLAKVKLFGVGFADEVIPNLKYGNEPIDGFFHLLATYFKELKERYSIALPSEGDMIFCDTPTLSAIFLSAQLCPRYWEPVKPLLNEIVLNLPKDYPFYFPYGYLNAKGGHAIFARLIRQSDDSFEISYFNSGEGTDFHPYAYIDGIRKTIPRWTLHKLPLSCITQYKFINTLLGTFNYIAGNSDHTPEDVYSALFSCVNDSDLIQKTPSLPDDKPAFANLHLAGSCTAASFLRAAADQFSKNHALFKEFEFDLIKAGIRDLEDAFHIGSTRQVAYYIFACATRIYSSRLAMQFGKRVKTSTHLFLNSVGFAESSFPLRKFWDEDDFNFVNYNLVNRERIGYALSMFKYFTSLRRNFALFSFPSERFGIKTQVPMKITDIPGFSTLIPKISVLPDIDTPLPAAPLNVFVPFNPVVEVALGTIGALESYISDIEAFVQSASLSPNISKNQYLSIISRLLLNLPVPSGRKLHSYQANDVWNTASVVQATTILKKFQSIMTAFPLFYQDDRPVMADDSVAGLLVFAISWKLSHVIEVKSGQPLTAFSLRSYSFSDNLMSLGCSNLYSFNRTSKDIYSRLHKYMSLPKSEKNKRKDSFISDLVFLSTITTGYLNVWAKSLNPSVLQTEYEAFCVKTNTKIEKLNFVTQWIAHHVVPNGPPECFYLLKNIYFLFRLMKSSYEIRKAAFKDLHKLMDPYNVVENNLILGPYLRFYNVIWNQLDHPMPALVGLSLPFAQDAQKIIKRNEITALTLKPNEDKILNRARLIFATQNSKLPRLLSTYKIENITDLTSLYTMAVFFVAFTVEMTENETPDFVNECDDFFLRIQDAFFVLLRIDDLSVSYFNEDDVFAFLHYMFIYTKFLLHAQNFNPLHFVYEAKMQNIRDKVLLVLIRVPITERLDMMKNLVFANTHLFLLEIEDCFKNFYKFMKLKYLLRREKIYSPFYMADAESTIVSVFGLDNLKANISAATRSNLCDFIYSLNMSMPRPAGSVWINGSFPVYSLSGTSISVNLLDGQVYVNNAGTNFLNLVYSFPEIVAYLSTYEIDVSLGLLSENEEFLIVTAKSAGAILEFTVLIDKRNSKAFVVKTFDLQKYYLNLSDTPISWIAPFTVNTNQTIKYWIDTSGKSVMCTLSNRKKLMSLSQLPNQTVLKLESVVELGDFRGSAFEIHKFEANPFSRFESPDHIYFLVDTSNGFSYISFPRLRLATDSALMFIRRGTNFGLLGQEHLEIEFSLQIPELLLLGNYVNLKNNKTSEYKTIVSIKKITDIVNVNHSAEWIDCELIDVQSDGSLNYNSRFQKLLLSYYSLASLEFKFSMKLLQEFQHFSPLVNSEAKLLEWIVDSPSELKPYCILPEIKAVAIYAAMIGLKSFRLFPKIEDEKKANDYGNLAGWTSHWNNDVTDTYGKIGELFLEYDAVEPNLPWNFHLVPSLVEEMDAVLPMSNFEVADFFILIAVKIFPNFFLARLAAALFERSATLLGQASFLISSTRKPKTHGSVPKAAFLDMNFVKDGKCPFSSLEDWTNGVNLLRPAKHLVNCFKLLFKIAKEGSKCKDLLVFLNYSFFDKVSENDAARLILQFICGERIPAPSNDYYTGELKKLIVSFDHFKSISIEAVNSALRNYLSLYRNNSKNVPIYNNLRGIPNVALIPNLPSPMHLSKDHIDILDSSANSLYNDTDIQTLLPRNPNTPLDYSSFNQYRGNAKEPNYRDKIDAFIDSLVNTGHLFTEDYVKCSRQAGSSFNHISTIVIEKIEARIISSLKLHSTTNLFNRSSPLIEMITQLKSFLVYFEQTLRSDFESEANKPSGSSRLKTVVEAIQIGFQLNPVTFENFKSFVIDPRNVDNSFIRFIPKVRLAELKKMFVETLPQISTSMYLRGILKALEEFSKLSSDDETVIGDLCSALHYGIFHDSKNIPILLYESKLGVILRKGQIEGLNRFFDKSTLKYNDLIQQRIMGGGKTLVWGTLTTFFKADSYHLSVYITPTALFQTNSKDFMSRASRVFGTKGIPLTFNRSVAQFRLLAMRSTRNLIHEAIVTKSFLIIPPETIQAMENKFVEALDFLSNLMLSYGREINSYPDGISEDNLSFTDIYFAWADSLSELQSILKVFKERGAATIDEIDSIFNPMKEYNFPTEEKSFADKFICDLIALTFRCTHLNASGNISARGFDIVNLDKMSLTGADSQEVAKAIRKETLDYIFSATEAENVKQVLTGSISPNDVYLYLLDEANDGAAVFGGLSADNHYHITLKERLLLVRKLFHWYFPSSLKEKVNEQYGSSRKDRIRNELAIPFAAANVPKESSEFADRWETIVKTGFILFYEGFRQSQVQKLVNQYVGNPKNLFLSNSHILNVNRIRFETCTGSNVREIYQLKSEAALWKTITDKINNHIRNRTEESCVLLLEYYLSRILFSTHEFYFEQIKNVPSFLGSAFNSYQGYSGTLDNIQILPQQFAQDPTKIIPDVGANEQLIGILLKPENGVVVELPDYGLSITSVLAKVVSTPLNLNEFHAIVDIGAYFLGKPNEEIAKELLSNLDNSIEGIIFFDDEGGKLSAITRKEPKKEIPGDLIGIKSLTGLEPKNWFVFYDQVHTTGVDLPHVDEARALVTFGLNTTQRDLLQGVMRMRKLKKGQKLSFVLPRPLEETMRLAISGKFNVVSASKITNVILFCKMNQMEREKRENFKVITHKMHDLVRRAVLEKLYSMSDLSTQLDLFRKSLHLFIMPSNFMESLPSPLIGETILDVFQKSLLNGLASELNMAQMNAVLATLKADFFASNVLLNLAELSYGSSIESVVEQQIQNQLEVAVEALKPPITNRHFGMFIDHDCLKISIFPETFYMKAITISKGSIADLPIPTFWSMFDVLKRLPQTAMFADLFDTRLVIKSCVGKIRQEDSNIIDSLKLAAVDVIVKLDTGWVILVDSDNRGPFIEEVEKGQSSFSKTFLFTLDRSLIAQNTVTPPTNSEIATARQLLKDVYIDIIFLMGFTESLEKLSDIEFNAWFLKGAKPLSKQYFYENVIMSDGERRNVYFQSQLKERIENLISLNPLTVDDFDTVAFLILSNEHSNIDVAVVMNNLKTQVEDGSKPIADVLKFVKFGLSLTSRKLALAAEIILKSAIIRFTNPTIENELSLWLQDSLNISYSKRIIDVLKEACNSTDTSILYKLITAYSNVSEMRLHYVTMIFRLAVKVNTNLDNQYRTLSLNVQYGSPIPSALLAELSISEISTCSPPYKKFLVEIAKKWFGINSYSYMSDYNETARLYRVLYSIIELSLFDNSLTDSLKTAVKKLLDKNKMLPSHPIAIKYGSD